MRFQLAILVCLLTGCAMQPTPVETMTAASISNRDLLLQLAHSNSMRLGVEFLPPAADELAVSALPAAARAQDPPRPNLQLPRPQIQPKIGAARRELLSQEKHTWLLSSDDLTSIHSSLERETLLFLDDVLEQDYHRSTFDLSTPILDAETIDQQSPLFVLPDGDCDADELAELMNERGLSLMRRPAQRLLRRMPIVHDAELEIQDFSSSNVPLSKSYRETHADQRSLGRVSVRVHAGQWNDPIEVNYLRRGFRIGSSQEHLKIGLQNQLTDSLRLDANCEWNYDTQGFSARAELSFSAGPQTSVHLLVSDSIDFLVTSNQHSLYSTPLDGSPGIMLYAVHRF